MELYEQVISHIKERKTELVENWMNRMKDEADERVVNVMTDQVLQRFIFRRQAPTI